MADIVWGPVVVHTGADMPYWLSESEQVRDVDPGKQTDGTVREASRWGWYGIKAFQLRHDHPHYLPSSLTADEVRSIVGGFDVANRMIAALECRNQLRRVTKAEVISKKTGMPVTDVERVIAAIAEEG